MHGENFHDECGGRLGTDGLGVSLGCSVHWTYSIYRLWRINWTGLEFDDDKILDIDRWYYDNHEATRGTPSIPFT